MLGFGWAYGFLLWWTHESGYIRRRVQVGARSEEQDLVVPFSLAHAIRGFFGKCCQHGMESEMVCHDEMHYHR